MIEPATVTAPEMIGLLVWWIVMLVAPVILVRRWSRRRKAAKRLRRQVGRPAPEQPLERFSTTSSHSRRQARSHARSAMPLLSISEATTPHSQIHRLSGTVATYPLRRAFAEEYRRVAVDEPQYPWRRR